MYTKTLILALFAAATASAAVIDTRQNNNNNGGVDFGLCNPAIGFELGRAGRQPDEGTFLPVDALVAQGQQDALNPNIITNRICDQLTNVCEANDAAKEACAAAEAAVANLPRTNDAERLAIVDAFNGALGV